MSITEQRRLEMKTPESAFVRVMTQEFGYAPRVAKEIMSVAHELLVGETDINRVRIGQIRQIVAKKSAPFGPPLSETEKITVTLTINAGKDDIEVEKREGTRGLRQGKILRVLDEALEQGGVLTQEDLGEVLGASARTIRRDIRELKAAGHTINTRGQVKGVGRGQTHKVQIIKLWLQRVGYDQIARQTHHSPAAIKRYIQTFIRVVTLYEEEYGIEAIKFICKTSKNVVNQYLELYETVKTNAEQLQKLKEELERVVNWSKPLEIDKKKREVAK